MPTAWLILLPVVLGLLGLVLVVTGWRGRRIDDHPICRKCKFDLIGVYHGGDGGAGTVSRCPECGRELGRRRAVWIGRRKKRWSLVVVGGGITTAWLVAAAVLGGSFAVGAKAYPYTPGWLLALEARYSSDRWGGPMLGELVQRIENNKLDPEVTAVLVREGLERQADRRRAWLGEWGDVVDAAYGVGVASVAQWDQFVRQMVVIEVVTKKRARVGQSASALARVVEVRGISGADRFYITMNPRKLAMGGAVVNGDELRVGSDMAVDAESDASPTSQVSLTFAGPATVGRVPWSVDWKLGVMTIGGRGWVGDWEVRCTGTIDVVGADEPVIDVIGDEATGKKVREAISIEQVVIGRWSRFHVGLHCGQRGVATALRVIIAWTDGQGRRVIAGARSVMVSEPGAGATTFLPVEAGQEIPRDLKRVDVILRSDLRAAEDEVGVESVWIGSDVVFKDVPVEDRRVDER